MKGKHACAHKGIGESHNITLKLTNFAQGYKIGRF